MMYNFVWFRRGPKFILDFSNDVIGEISEIFVLYSCMSCKVLSSTIIVQSFIWLSLMISDIIREREGP